MEKKPFAEERPKIGLALGGGGARAYAHLGVIKALEEANIPIDIVTGTSMGAIIGAAYAAGYRSDKLVNLALQMKWKRLLSLADPTLSWQGVIAGNRLEKYFEDLTERRDFDQLATKLVIIATDLNRGEEVRLKSGSVARALRASTAMPGLFCPVKSGGNLLVDGSLITPVPTEAAVEAGATAVVAVDVCSSVDRTDAMVQAWKWWNKIALRPTLGLGTSVFSYLLKPVMPASIKIVSRSLDLYDRCNFNVSSQGTSSMHDWLLKPTVGNVRWYEFHRIRECIRAGENAGRQMVKQISNFLERGV